MDTVRLFRFQDDGDHCEIVEVEVIRETTKGWWIARNKGEGYKDNTLNRLFISKRKGGKLKYAYPTLIEALFGYVNSKKDMIDVNQKKIQLAKKQIEFAQTIANMKPN